MRSAITLAFVACTLIACQDATQPGITEADPHGQPHQEGRTLIDLGTLGGQTSLASDINDHGTVVGTSQTAAGASHAFRWTQADGMVDLGTLAGDESSMAVAINNQGDVLGESTSSSGPVHIVVWQKDKGIATLNIPPLDNAAMRPADLNNQGEVVGNAVGGADFTNRAWLWSAETGLVDVGIKLFSRPFENYASQINAVGSIVGTLGSGAGNARAFLKSPSGLIDIGVPETFEPDRSDVFGAAINEGGTVAGWAQDFVEQVRTAAFTWTRQHGFTLLSTLGNDGVGIATYDLSDSGMVVGTAPATATESAIHPVAWPTPDRVIDLDPSNPNAGVALAVNNAGQSVGWRAFDNSGQIRATLWDVHAIARENTWQAPALAGRSGSGAKAPRQVPGAEACLSNLKARTSRANLLACVGRAMGLSPQANPSQSLDHRGY
jgi:probable HAF family extracellular repeat protein